MEHFIQFSPSRHILTIDLTQYYDWFALCQYSHFFSPDEGQYEVVKSTNIPPDVGRCSINTTDHILQWIIDWTIAVQYIYSMGQVIKSHFGNYFYSVQISYTTQAGAKLNLTSVLKVIC